MWKQTFHSSVILHSSFCKGFQLKLVLKIFHKVAGLKTAIRIWNQIVWNQNSLINVHRFYKFKYISWIQFILQFNVYPKF